MLQQIQGWGQLLQTKALGQQQQMLAFAQSLQQLVLMLLLSDQ